MARKKKPIVRINKAAQLPSFMKNEEPVGMEQLRTYMIPPRLKIVQKQASEELLAEFGIGDVIVSPMNHLVSEMETSSKGQPTGDSDGFNFIPIFFFPEWCVWNDYKLRGSAPTILERSLDPMSEVALCAKNPSTRIKQHPDSKDLKIRYVEHLNFIIHIPGLDDYPIMSFAKGGHSRGSSFCALARQRKAPLFGCVFHARQKQLTNEGGSWWVLDIQNPEDSQWVEDKEKFAEFKKMHEECKKAHVNSLITPSYDDDDESPAPESNEY